MVFFLLLGTSKTNKRKIEKPCNDARERRLWPYVIHIYIYRYIYVCLARLELKHMVLLAYLGRPRLEKKRENESTW